jgi:hypothetical protein
MTAFVVPEAARCTEILRLETALENNKITRSTELQKIDGSTKALN